VPGGPTIDQRFESYYNYCQIFNYILSADTPVDLELPNQWLWEIIDEFIYQFQAGLRRSSQFRMVWRTCYRLQIRVPPRKIRNIL
jgi:hypothetical protein